MKLTIILTAFVFKLIEVNCQNTNSRCTLKIDEILANDPLLLTENGTFFQLEEIDRKKTVSVKDQQMINVICTGDSNEFVKFAGNSLDLKCLEGNLQDEKGTKVEKSEDLLCKAPSDSLLKPTSLSICSDNHASYQIGFDFENCFLNLINICRNENLRRTQYTYFWMTKDAYYTSSAKGANKQFKGDDDDLYKNNTKQLKSIEDQLELNGMKIDERNNRLSRGHLSANSDLVFAPEMAATYYYHNAAPQWQGFNGGNWNKVETQLRKYLWQEKLDVLVYTGVYGTLALNKKDGTTMDIYLDMDNKILPAPEFFWKILRDSKIAVVGYNNIFVDENEALKKANSFCFVTDCKNTGWLNLDGGNRADKGLIFCCEANAEFLNKIELNLQHEVQEEMFRCSAPQSNSSKILILMCVIYMIFS